MLILTRRVGETLKVGDEVSVTILGVRGSQIRIGITAPKGINVCREEIYQKDNASATAASNAAAADSEAAAAAAEADDTPSDTATSEATSKATTSQ